jgi:hypothetical protein
MHMRTVLGGVFRGFSPPDMNRRSFDAILSCTFWFTRKFVRLSLAGWFAVVKRSQSFVLRNLNICLCRTSCTDVALSMIACARILSAAGMQGVTAFVWAVFWRVFEQYLFVFLLSHHAGVL